MCSKLNFIDCYRLSGNMGIFGGGKSKYTPPVKECICVCVCCSLSRVRLCHYTVANRSIGRVKKSKLTSQLKGEGGGGGGGVCIGRSVVSDSLPPHGL